MTKLIVVNSRLAFALLVAVQLLAFPTNSPAIQGHEIKVGFLAHLGVDKAQTMWQPTMRYLHEKIPNYRFSLIPLTNDDMGRIVEQGQIDFLLTNPASYANLEAKFGLSRIATLRKRDKNASYTVFGAVIFTRKDRDDITSLTDLTGKSFMGVHRNGFGGWWMAWRELKQQQIDPYKDLSKLSFSGFPQTKVVHAVLGGEVDAGNVRTGVLENMAKEGQIDLDQVRILNPQHSIYFPANHSTRLYPEWPFAALRHVPYEITQQIALALFSMESSDPAAMSANIAGWTIPLDYKPVHDLMKELKVGHYRDRGEIGISDIFARYWRSLSAIIAVISALATLLVMNIRLNKRLMSSNKMLQNEIIEREKLQDKLRYQALHDSLTELPNRVFFNDSIKKNIRSCREKNQHFAVALIDLDRFKEVNDSLGHQAGDQLLQQVAKRLFESLRDNHTVARLGGDEFAMIMDTDQKENALDLARQILNKLSDPIDVNGRQLLIGASMGIAQFPNHGEDADILVRHADVAMYEAKRSGMNVMLYDAKLDLHSESRLTFESEIREALSAEQSLEVLYQPRIDCKSSAVRCMEAVVRWHHPLRGVIYPGEFVPVIEDLGLMESLTVKVLEKVLKDYVGWRDKGYEFSISINVGARALVQMNFAEKILAMLNDYKISPKNLEIEIGQGINNHSCDQLMQGIAPLQKLGTVFSIDNFGENTLPFNHLSRMPLSGIKIDRSYILDVTTSEINKEIVSSSISMAHKLGLWVTAAGVEDKQTWSLLKKLDSDYAQGFFFCKPLSHQDMTCWMESTDWVLQNVRSDVTA